MKPNRQAVHDKYKGHCAYCGCGIAIKDMQVDHVIPAWRVSALFSKVENPVKYDAVHCHENHMPSCRSCNNYKSGNPLEVFRKSIQNQIEVLRRDRPTFRLAERFGLIKCQPQRVIFYFEMCDAQPRYTPDTLPVLGSEVIAYDQACDPHRMSVTETWAMRMFDYGYAEWAELPSFAPTNTNLV